MPQHLNELIASLNNANTTGGHQIDLALFVVLLVVSLVSSFFISFLYLQFYTSRATGSQVHRAFPLLGLAITAIFICIQFSLPLSLGLLGALSIVRFRTPIKEPEEIGFIMIVIAMAIAVATFKLVFAGIVLVIAVVALAVQGAVRLFQSRTNDGAVVVAVPSGDHGVDAAAVTEALRKRVANATLESVSQSNAETVLSYSFRSIKEADLLALPADVRAAAANATLNVFFNRPGAL